MKDIRNRFLINSGKGHRSRLWLAVGSILAFLTLLRRKPKPVPEKAGAAPVRTPVPAGKPPRSKKAIPLCILAVFLLAAGVSLPLSARVRINYDISDYLPDGTQTRVAMDLIEQEFGMTGSVQVMARNITPEEAGALKQKLEAIPNVLTVSFDAGDPRYYRNGSALFAILVNGDDYSDEAKQVSADIRALLDGREGIEYGGTAIRKQILQDTITREMAFILVLSLCLVVVILLITSQSWLEPLILLAASGVAVLINRGTNLLFGEISYITNSIAAILQLALSIDYSIVLLHAYRACRAEEADAARAMRRAIRQVVRPVSASAMTTVAGLIALLFMRFTIGFDVGTVLIKGIVISALCSLTLLPALVLLLEGPVERTAKHAFRPRGRAFSALAVRAGKGIVPLALALVLVCGILQTGTVYTFSDKTSTSDAITETFGRNNTVVAVWKTTPQDRENEQRLIDRLSALRKADGSPVLTGYTAYSNTAQAPLDTDALADRLGLPRPDAALLIALAELDGNPDAIRLSPADLEKTVLTLLASADPDVTGAVSEEVREAVAALVTVQELLDRENTAGELYAALPAALCERLGLTLFQTEQLYGLYFLDTVEDPSVPFVTMLERLAAATTDPNTAPFFTAESAAQVNSLQDGVNTYLSTFDAPTDRAGLRSFCSARIGISLTDEQADRIFHGYCSAAGISDTETAPLIGLLRYMVENRWITNPLKAAVVRQYLALYDRIGSSCTETEFLPTLCDVVEGLTGSRPTLSVPDSTVRQLYIWEFRLSGRIPDGTIGGREVIRFLLDTQQTDETVASLLPAGAVAALDTLLRADAFFRDGTPYGYPEMRTQISDLLAPLSGLLTGAGTELSPDLLRGIYIKYAAENGVPDLSVPACDLLAFLLSHADTDPLLAGRITDENRALLTAAEQELARAEALFRSETLSRMILSVDLPNESDDSAAFAAALTDALHDVFGPDACAAGELISNRDLRSVFTRDSRVITVFTLVSIFLIVMLIFRSLSLPVLLVGVIQGAIFIAMATQLSGDGVFFMSYVVSLCILMGATIDYGILMSSGYLSARRTQEKAEALQSAVSAAMPTVFSSGLILSVCGFVIHFLSSQYAINTVGLLIGIGTLSSVGMITLVLPSLLYLFDGFVRKFSFRGKRN